MILACAAVIGYALVVGRATRWPIEVAIAGVIALLMPALFWLGFAGVLGPGARVLLGAGLAALVWALVGRGFARPLSACLTPGLAAFVVGAALLAWRLAGAHFMYWDEFAQWGLQSKTIALTHALAGADTAVEFKDYPTGAALFQYFALAGGFDEGVAITANGLVTLGALLTVTQSLSWRAAPVAAALAVSAGASVWGLGQGFESLLIDQVIGAVFGGTIAAAVLAPEGERGTAWRAVPGLLALPLLKAIGFQFAVLAAGTVFVDTVLRWRASTSLATAASAAGTSDVAGTKVAAPLRPSRPIVAAAIMLGVLLAAPVVSKAGWGAWTDRIHARNTFAPPSPITTMRRAFSDAATEHDRGTLVAFRQALTTQTILVGDGMPIAARLHLAAPGAMTAATLPQALTAFLLLAGLVVALQPHRGAVWRAAAIQGCLALGLAAYVVGHLQAYLDMFAPWEGLHAASMDRYLRTYFLGWAIVSLGQVAVAVRAGGSRGRAAVALTLGLAVAAFVTLPSRGVEVLRHGAPPLAPARAALATSLERVRAGVGPDRGVYLVFQHTTGLDHWIAKYELAPRRTNLECWSIGPATPDFPWTCSLTPAELAVRLRGYDYVFLGLVDDAFLQTYAALLPTGAGREPSLYAVHAAADGAVTLTLAAASPAASAR